MKKVWEGGSQTFLPCYQSRLLLHRVGILADLLLNLAVTAAYFLAGTSSSYLQSCAIFWSMNVVHCVVSITCHLFFCFFMLTDV